MGNLAEEINSKFDNEYQKAFLNIKFTSSYLSNISDKIFIKYNISSQQYNVLRILRGAKKAIKVSTVKERMIEKSPNTTRLMDKLVTKDLIFRSRREKDRRAVYVEITKNGLDLVNSINVDDQKINLANISTEEAIELNRLLDKIR
jgi:MarR family 2-MHQ and catechol resistance regulon transcriptional repressor